VTTLKMQRKSTQRPARKRTSLRVLPSIGKPDPEALVPLLRALVRQRIEREAALSSSVSEP
jgi:hypothetical protein